MKNLTLKIGALYGALGVILGAFGAHALKGLLSTQQLQSYETGVRYQLIHAVVLLFVGFYFDFSQRIHRLIAWFYILGVLLFSLSIYLLSLSSVWGVKLSFLGPITPLGGLLLILAWVLLFFSFSTKKN